MNWVLRIQKLLLDRVRADLSRPHPVAYERVGFLYTRSGVGARDETIILVVDYESVAESGYIEDKTVGARIGAAPITSTIQRALSDGVGVLHVHAHHGKGAPGFSRVDLASYPKLVSAWQAAQPNGVHGAVVLSDDSLTAQIWLPGHSKPLSHGRIAVVGRPMEVFPNGRDLAVG